MELCAVPLVDGLVPFVYEVFEQNREVLHGNVITIDEWRYCFGEGADPYEANFIIMHDNTPAAWLKLNGLQKPVICLAMLVVADEFKHKGVGRFAIQFSEKYAKDNSKSAILIQTTKDNIVASECYLKFGYQIIREMIYKVGDGIDRAGYEFKKEIE